MLRKHDGPRGSEKDELTMREKKAAIYVRVSTSDQDTGLQQTELQQYVESRGWDYVMYRDKAQSGAKNDRPALNAMLTDMRRRRFDVVVVWKLDRLARSLKQLLTIGEECRSLGVDLVFAPPEYRHHFARRKTHVSDSGSGGGV
jgi:DNA invertase Pin-like site-specific DNA recombinase